MAMKPSTICKHCNGIVPGGQRCSRCTKVRNRQHDMIRGTAAERGYGATWRAYRLTFLASHPLCEWQCGDGRACNAPATDVDHVVPVSGPDDPSFWQSSGHQALCGYHHKVKSARDGSRHPV